MSLLLALLRGRMIAYERLISPAVVVTFELQILGAASRCARESEGQQDNLS